MVGNLFAHIVERNPLSRARELVFVNNLVYNRGKIDLDVQSERRRVTKSSVEGNVFLRGPSYAVTRGPSTCAPAAPTACTRRRACTCTTTTRRRPAPTTMIVS